VQELYAEAYRGEPFVRVLPPGVAPGPKAVHGSNLCDVSVFVDAENERLVVVSSIDNLMKGQAANALQNVNLMLGIDETLGLDRIPLYP
jgi:N-acetyl-gamma-glutamyl-phosphate reductase